LRDSLKKFIKFIFSMVKKLSILILILVCIIPLIIIPLVPRVIDYVEEIRYPEDNFVMIYLISMSDIQLSDTGISNGYPDVYEGQASGMAIADSDGKTYVLTADHFCDNFDEMYIARNFLNLGSILQIYDFYGDYWDAKIVMQDSKLDLCLIETNMPISREINVAEEMPELGDEIYSIAAPLGFGGNGAALHFNGQFSGCDGSHCYFTIPAAGGSSGSLILNGKGEVVGMTQMAAHRMQNVAFGVGAAQIRDFLTRAEEELDADLL